LIISVIALLISIFGYTSSETEKDLKARLQDFQAKMEQMKTESNEQIDKIRNETAKALEKMSNAVKKEEGAKAQGESAPGATTN
jgi:gas vesicle protein